MARHRREEIQFDGHRQCAIATCSHALGISRAAERIAGDGFDLIMVDGEYRADCVEVARSCLRPGGMVYLDNSDVEPDAKKNLARLAKERGATIRLFTDFAPTAFFVNQGMLATFP